MSSSLSLVLFQQYWGQDPYNHLKRHAVLHRLKVILLTCKPAWQVAAGNVSGNVDDTATGKCLHMFGIQNIHDQFVLESHLLCLHGEQKWGNYRYEKLPDVLQSLFIEVSAKFLRWYLFEYLKPKCMFASCVPPSLTKS